MPPDGQKRFLHHQPAHDPRLTRRRLDADPAPLDSAANQRRLERSVRELQKDEPALDAFLQSLPSWQRINARLALIRVVGAQPARVALTRALGDAETSFPMVPSPRPAPSQPSLEERAAFAEAGALAQGAMRILDGEAPDPELLGGLFAAFAPHVNRASLALLRHGTVGSALTRQIARGVSPSGDLARGAALAPAVQRRAATIFRRGLGGGEVDLDHPAIVAALDRAGQGAPLDEPLRLKMEGQLGADFRGVRVHTDGVAARAAAALHSSAFTLGEDLFFAEGAFAPATESGWRLLVHELAHVTQAQRGSTPASPSQDTTRPSPGGLRVSQPDDPLEREAETAALAADPAHARTGGAAPAAATAQSNPPPAAAAAAGPAGSGGGLTFQLDPSSLELPSGGALQPRPLSREAQLFSARFSLAGWIQASGGDSSQRAHWEVGATQTVFQSDRYGYYRDAAGAEVLRNADRIPRVPIADVGHGMLSPWYRGRHVSLGQQTGALASIDDHPNTGFAWHAPPAHGGSGRMLSRIAGTDRFCAWLIAKNGADVRYLKFVVWHVDYAATVDAAAHTIAPTGSTVIDCVGEGQGPRTPTLSGHSMEAIVSDWRELGGAPPAADGPAAPTHHRASEHGRQDFRPAESAAHYDEIELAGLGPVREWLQRHSAELLALSDRRQLTMTLLLRRLHAEIGNPTTFDRHALDAVIRRWAGEHQVHLAGSLPPAASPAPAMATPPPLTTYQFRLPPWVSATARAHPEGQTGQPAGTNLSSPPWSEVVGRVRSSIDAAIDLQLIQPRHAPPRTGTDPSNPAPPSPEAQQGGPGSGGDAVSAVLALPAVHAAVDRLKTQVLNRAAREWHTLATGERVLTVVAAVPIVAATSGIAVASGLSSVRIPTNLIGVGAEIRFAGPEVHVTINVDVPMLLDNLRSWLAPSTPSVTSPDAEARQAAVALDAEDRDRRRVADTLLRHLVEMRALGEALHSGAASSDAAVRSICLRLLSPSRQNGFVYPLTETHDGQARARRAGHAGQSTWFGTRDAYPDIDRDNLSYETAGEYHAALGTEWLALGQHLYIFDVHLRSVARLHAIFTAFARRMGTPT